MVSTKDREGHSHVDLKERALRRLRELLAEAERDSAFGEFGVMVDFRNGVPYRCRKVVNATEEQ